MNSGSENNEEHAQAKVRSLSSPIRHGDHVENTSERQKVRHTALYYPLSSPIKGLSIYQGSASNRSNVINRRNKHDKLKEIRQRHLQEKLSNNREKQTNRQASQDRLQNLQTYANILFDDNELIEMEQRESQEKTEEEKLQLELEEYLRAEQEELEGLISNLEL